MKIFLRALALTGVLAVVGIVLLALSFTTLVKAGVETMGAKVLGVPVTLEDVDLSLSSDRSILQADLTQLTIANPEGYETAHALSLPSVQVRVDWASLLDETVVVESVRIVKPRVTFERLRLGSNLNDLRRNVVRNVGSDSDDADDDAREERDEDEESEPRVHIKRLTLEDAELAVSLLGGTRGVMQVPLPDLELRDIGKPSEGAGLREASAKIFHALYAAVLKAVTQSGTVIPDKIKELGQSAGDLGKSMEKAGKELLKGLLKGL